MTNSSLYDQHVTWRRVCSRGSENCPWNKSTIPAFFLSLVHYTFDTSPPFFSLKMYNPSLTELLLMSIAFNFPLRNLLKSLFSWLGNLGNFPEHTVPPLNTSNLLTPITESEMFTSPHLSHLITPSSLPPRKPVKSVAWEPQAKVLWGLSRVCPFFAIAWSWSKLIPSGFLKKKKGRKEEKKKRKKERVMQI